MDEIRSIWDGWEKQCFNIGATPWGGRCATNWALKSDYQPVFRRVAAAIRRKFDVPVEYMHTSGLMFSPVAKDWDCIVYANNVLKLTPEDFRRIDRETFIEEQARNLVESVPERVEELECVPQS